MYRLFFLTWCVFASAMMGCADSAQSPPVTELDEPVIETATELPPDSLEALEQENTFSFQVDGSAGPAATYALDEGGECLVYASHIVRLLPVEEDSDDHSIELVTRADGASPFELCDAEADVEVPTRAGVDLFVGLDGTTLWTRRDSRGRDLLRGYDFEIGEEVFSELVTPPVFKDAEGLTYGGPPEAMASRDALEASGVTCPEAEAWFADGRSVAISRRLRFSFATSETTDAGEALCFVHDDA